MSGSKSLHKSRTGCSLSPESASSPGESSTRIVSHPIDRPAHRLIHLGMFIIWKLQRLTKKLRAERGLPPIDDPNDIPDPSDAQDYVSVLSEKQQAQLRHQQEQFAKSQTWYRPHATATHTAFPISWALGNTLASIDRNARCHR